MFLIAQIFTQQRAPKIEGMPDSFDNQPLVMPPPQFNGPELEAICRALGFYIAQNPSIQSAKSAQMKMEHLAAAWKKYVREQS